MINLTQAIRAALAALAIATTAHAAIVTPAAAYQPFPTDHLSNAPLGTNAAWNPSAEVMGGLPGNAEDMGLLTTSRYLVVTTDILVGVPMTTVSILMDGITKKANLVQGQTILVDFGPRAKDSSGREVFFIYSSEGNATALSVRIDAIAATVS